MIGVKPMAEYIVIGWFACVASACLADPGSPQLLGEWAKIVKVDAHTAKSREPRTQFDSSDMEFAFTKQEGGLVKGTKIATNKQEAISCKIGGDNKTIVCEDESGIFQGEIYSSDEIVGTYRARSDSTTISTLILRKKR